MTLRCFYFYNALIDIFKDNITESFMCISLIIFMHVDNICIKTKQTKQTIS
jgi:hypothetical protein